jgi:hypothetical protein
VETPFFSRFSRAASLGIAVLALMACGTTSTVTVAAATATPAATATATSTPAPTATATPAPGVCRSADFPTRTTGGPEGLQYPPLTYYYDLTPGMGSHPYQLCSSGTPSSIIAFMKTSVKAAGWKITNSTTTSLTAEKPTNPPSGYCYTVDMQAGTVAGYPGEWSANFHAPAAACV